MCEPSGILTYSGSGHTPFSADFDSYSVYSGPGKQVGLHGLLVKRWLIPLLVILIIVLAVETAILVIIVSQSVFGGRQLFPGISFFRFVAPGFPTLGGSVECSTGINQSF